MNGPALPALTLYRLGKMVTASLDLRVTLEAIVAAAHELLESESTAILLLDARAGIRSFLAAPLVWRGVSLGVMAAGSLRPGVYSDPDVDLATELAEQAAAGVAHARDFAQELERRMELENLNRALMQAEQRLVQTEKLTAIGHLANGIAHEVNTPLGVIISNLSVLAGYGESLGRLAVLAQTTARGLRSGECLETVATALEAGLAVSDLDFLLEDLPALTSESTASANRIADMSRSLSMFARDGTGADGPINVEDALEAALTLAHTELKHRAKLVRAFGGVAAVVGNASDLTQVFVHLLLNASQACDGNSGLVTVSTVDEDDHVAVRVADNGCGIPQESLARVFEPFFTTRSVGEGTGLGLSVCHGIVTRHAGTIDIDSRLGAGTTVTVHLPAATGIVRASR